MPNWCWNHITVTGERAVLDDLMKDDNLQGIPDEFFSKKASGQGIEIFNMGSRWEPEYEWLESLLDKYPDIWIKNMWSEEGGREGVWIGTNRGEQKEIKRLEWEGMCIEEEAHRFRKVGEDELPMNDAGPIEDMLPVDAHPLPAHITSYR
jgi:hypothetical protein